MNEFKYKTSFSSQIKSVISEEKDKYLSLAVYKTRRYNWAKEKYDAATTASAQAYWSGVVSRQATRRATALSKTPLGATYQALLDAL